MNGNHPHEGNDIDEDYSDFIENITPEQLARWRKRDADFEGYLDEMAAEAQAISEWSRELHFQHAYVSASPADVAMAFLNIGRRGQLRYGNITTGNQLPWHGHPCYLAPAGQGTLLWTFADEPWLVDLSGDLASTVYYLKVNEDAVQQGLCCGRLFLHLENGQVIHHLRDPKPSTPMGQPWVEYQGHQQFADADQFVKEISQWYVPLDRFWTFRAWNDRWFEDAQFLADTGMPSSIQNAVGIHSHQREENVFTIGLSPGTTETTQLRQKIEDWIDRDQ